MQTSSSAEAVARRAPHDSEPDTDPGSLFWQGAPSVHFSSDFYGKPVQWHSSEVLLQWTPGHLYLLFICPYQQLHLKPNPDRTAETYELWDWDVAEVFIGCDFDNIRRYKEFEVSPQSEWVDLDVNLDNPPHETGWDWQSGCTAAGRINERTQTWYGFLRIPWAAIDIRPAAAGNLLRINFFRAQGADPDRKYIAWQPAQRPSFHTPEVFGTLRLVD